MLDVVELFQARLQSEWQTRTLAANETATIDFSPTPEGRVRIYTYIGHAYSGAGGPQAYWAVVDSGGSIVTRIWYGTLPSTYSYWASSFLFILPPGYHLRFWGQQGGGGSGTVWVTVSYVDLHQEET